MRQITFQISDGSTVDLEVQPRFEQIVREQFGLDEGKPVSDADLKRFFIASMTKASE